MKGTTSTQIYRGTQNGKTTKPILLITAKLLLHNTIDFFNQLQLVRMHQHPVYQLQLKGGYDPLVLVSYD